MKIIHSNPSDECRRASAPSGGERAFPSRPSSLVPRPLLAFTLVEMMVTVALLSFIVLGLTAMFIQTQRAFRAGMTQTDVLEAGRATMEMLTRDVEQISPAGLLVTPTGVIGATNFYVGYTNNYTTNALTGSGPRRTNVTAEIFLLSHNNRQWSGIGYVITSPTYPGQPFTLYRFATNCTDDTAADQLPKITRSFFKDDITSFSRIVNGAVHLRARAYSTNGVLLTEGSPMKNAFIFTNFSSSAIAPGEINYVFTNNAVPAYVELELGVLEQEAWERFKSIPNPDPNKLSPARAMFFSGQRNIGGSNPGISPVPGVAGGIHIFRRRIAVHNVDPEVYQ